jgi:hypothetical protein
MTRKVGHDWVCPAHDDEIWGCDGDDCCCRHRHYPRQGFWARLWGRLAGAPAEQSCFAWIVLSQSLTLVAGHLCALLGHSGCSRRGHRGGVTHVEDRGRMQ